MARPLRIERAGGWYHVTARGNERKAIYRDDRDREHFLELLEEMVDRFRVALHAYVLMPNHYHLIIELREPNLSRAVQWLNVSYGVWFNRRRNRSGHLFQGRFKSVVVDEREWALSLSRYVHLNPVRVKKLGLGKRDRIRQRVGLSPAASPEIVRERIALLREFKWSSYRAYIRAAPGPKWLETQTILRMGGGPAAERWKNYRKYVEEAVREGLPSAPWEELKEQAVLGSQAFVRELRQHIRGDDREQRGAARLVRPRPTLPEVIRCVEGIRGEKWADFRDRHGDSGRDLVLYLARKHCGLTLGELAAEAGIRHYATVGIAIKRFGKRLERPCRERAESGQAEQKLYVET